MSGLSRLAAPGVGFSSKVSLIHTAPARHRQQTVRCFTRLHSATAAANQRRTTRLSANQLTSSSPSTNQLLPLSCSANWRWQQWREFRDFGHGPPQKQSWGYRAFQAVVCLMVLSSLFNWKLAREIWNRDKSVQAAAVTSADRAEAEGESDGEEEEEEEEEDDKKSQKVGFRDRKIIEYENRIRQYSTPDKIFRYFATLRVIHDLPDGNTSSEVYMTPLDFLRSITPGVKQPEGLGLDQYKRFDPKNSGEELHLDLDPDSIFFKLGSHGLISFSDYIFLLTIMSTSSRQFEIAFQMFDFNGDGDVDSEEFEKVSVLIRQQTSVGSRHRDHTNTGSTFRGINSALSTYFFGQKLDKKLTIEKFLDFQSQLQREILCLEFKRKMPNEDGLLKESDFADLLLAYGGYPPNRKLKMMRRVKKKFKESPVGVSVNDYLNFYQLLNSIHDVDTALTFYHIAGASIDPATLKHVARTVARVDLSDHVVDIVFTLFDDNNDGQLSNREFVAVMKARANRGLEKPKDTNFVRLLRAVSKCIGETKPQVLSF